MKNQRNNEPGFVELHIIQNFPPSNLNRDDLGQPKMCDFGGFHRARISSQCLKRSIRTTGKNPNDPNSQSVFERFTGVLSDRTRLIVSGITKRLTDTKYNRPVEAAEHLAIAFAEEHAGGIKQTETNVILYLN